MKWVSRHNDSDTTDFPWRPAAVPAIAFFPMTSIVRASLETGSAGAWDGLARQVAAWLDANRLPLRESVVLVPFVQLLPPARRAFAQLGDWMPRVETTRTLAASLGAPVDVPAGQLSFDPTLDALSAALLLRSQAWGAAWERRDSRGFEQAVRALVSTAQAMAAGAAGVAPDRRESHWTTARESLAPSPGPGGTERLLARVALEWARLAPAPATDRLFDARPAAWIVVQAGGPDRVARALLAQGETPGCLVDLDPDEERVFDGLGAPPSLAVCDGFEQEAQRTAAQVLRHVQKGEIPVALIAADRVLVRRVRALLDRHGLRLHDETGWKLSTTRAAAVVMSLLTATRPDAGTDALVEWLKSVSEDAPALDALEAFCRQHQVGRISDLRGRTLAPPADRAWTMAAKVLDAFGNARRQTLANWLALLGTALEGSGMMAMLAGDDAGRNVLAELHLGSGSSRPAWLASANQVAMSAPEFRHWVDSVLEHATFRPAASFEGPADVVVTPLAQAVMRPFPAVVLPGADERHLGAAHGDATLLDEAQSVVFGVPTAKQRRSAELLAFSHVLRMPRQVSLLRRRSDGKEPLAPSPLVERLELSLARRRLTFSPSDDPRVQHATVPTPISRPAPSAPSLLPTRLSASACEALRACPYRFFALYVLRLREDDELEREIEKRDYGNWLHGVLYEFHRTRPAPVARNEELARLEQVAAEQQRAFGIADADFLPFAASFATFAPRYIDWLHGRDARGLRWMSGEEEVALAFDALGGTELRGVIDRIDEFGHGDDTSVEVIDYKTGSAGDLKDKVKDRLEDTQLAFYAALMRGRTTQPIVARYLALDGTKGLEEIEHPNVEDSAAALLAGLAEDLRRLRDGAGMAALGAGSTCAHCAARGICRRDHWADV